MSHSPFFSADRYPWILWTSAQRADTARCPSLSLPRLHTHSIESGGNVCVRPPGRHRPHDSKGCFRSTLAMFTSVGFANAQLRVLATFPVDCQNDFALLFIDVGNDIGDQRTKESCWRQRMSTLGARHAASRSAARPVKIWDRRGKISLSRFLQARFTILHAPGVRLPSFSQVARQSACCRDRRQHSGVRPATRRSGPVAESSSAMRCRSSRFF